MACSSLTTIAEEIISLLHYLHESNDWCDMINYQIWKRLELLRLNSQYQHVSFNFKKKKKKKKQPE